MSADAACNGAMCFSCGAQRRVPGEGGSAEEALFKCSRCQVAFYCCKACQAADWPLHKKVCKKLSNPAGTDAMLTLAAGQLPTVAKLLAAVEDPLCVTLRQASALGGATAELVLLLNSHGLPRAQQQLPPKAYAEVSRLLAAGADPCKDLRIFPDAKRADAVAAAQRLAAARASGRPVLETSHLSTPGAARPEVKGMACALALAVRCGEERLLGLLTGQRGAGAPPLRPNALYLVDTGSFVTLLSMAFAAPLALAPRMVAAVLALGADANGAMAVAQPRASGSGGGGGGVGGGGAAAMEAAAVEALVPQLGGLLMATPLHFATASHNGRTLPTAELEEVTRALVSAGAGVNAFNHEGLPPVSAALQQFTRADGRRGAEAEALARHVEVLLELGADANCRAVAPTPAYRPLDFLSLLAAPGAPPLPAAPPTLLWRTLQALRRAGADFNRLVLHMGSTGSMESSPQAARAFKGMDTVVAVDYLALAVMRGCSEMVAFALREAGVSPNSRSPLASKQTLLHTACMLGRVEVVELLLGAGADPRLTAYDGSTPRESLHEVDLTGEGAALSKGARAALDGRLAAAEAAWAGRPVDASETRAAAARRAGAAAAPARAPSAAQAAALAAGRCPLGDLAAQEQACGVWWGSGRTLGQVREAGEAGDLAAAAVLGELYTGGLRGAPVDHQAALAWAQRAASLGNVASAQYRVGVMHEMGQGGLSAGGSAAPRLYRCAAEQGHALARYRLGVCFSKGRGVARDVVEAARHWRAAADMGVAPAQADLSNAHVHGIGVAVDYGEAARLAAGAEAGGLHHGALMLGMLAHNGWGMAKDPREAARWWARSVELGEDTGQALQGLRGLAAMGLPQAMDAVQRLGGSAAAGGARAGREG